MEIKGNRYMLLYLNKSNTNSDIYISKDLKNNNNAVSIKKLKIGTLKENIVNELFFRETSALERLDHPSIIKYIDSFEEDNEKYIVMECFESKDLKEYIKNNNLTQYEKIKIIIKIIEGINYAHEKDVLHRDLKPENIIINQNQEIKIIDFGLSKIIDYIYTLKNETVKEYLSVAYASPEQLLRQDFTIKSDYYSLGLVIYFIIAQEDPPTIRHDLLSSINMLDCHEDIKNVVYELTEYDQNNRPNSLSKIIRKLLKCSNELLSIEKKIYLRFLNHIGRTLYNLGVVNSITNIDYIRKKIEKDVNSSYFYTYKNNFYIVGEILCYKCKKDINYGGLLILDVEYIGDQIEYDKKKAKAVEVPIGWTVLNEKQSIRSFDSTDEIIGVLVNAERENIVKNKREKIKNDLLDKWDKYLQEEFKLLNTRDKVCEYSSFKLDDTGYNLIVELYPKDVEVNFEQGDYIQLTSKKKEQITIGQYCDASFGKIEISLQSGINIEDISEKGNIGIDTVKASANFRRFARALNAIKFSNTTNPRLSEIISNPAIVEMNTVCDIDSYYQKILGSNKDMPQTTTVRNALATKDIFMIQGPPGTGKTTVITEIVCQIIKENPKAKVLLASQSHVAVDHAINKIGKYLKKEQIIRIGRTEKISEESQNLIISTQLTNWIRKMHDKTEENLKKYLENKYLVQSDIIDKLIKKDTEELCIELDENYNKINRLIVIIKEWQRRLGKLDEFDEIFADQASLVAATCSGIASRSVLNSVEFDWVIVDEAARATPLELLIPMVKGKKIILVGDHRQLPPIIKTDIPKIKMFERGIRTSDLEKSLFEELFENISVQAKNVLNVQFRMHPSIGRLIGQVFYKNDDIKTGISSNERSHNLKWWYKSIIWINTYKGKNNREENIGISKQNKYEAEVILKLVEKIQKNYKDIGVSGITIGIITGYNGQKNLLKSLVNPGDLVKWKNIKIIIDNIDAFQGSETDIIIYSVVRNNDENKIGFLYDSRRLNVALSRGKCCLIIVGNREFLENAVGINGNPFKDIISYMRINRDNCIMEDN